MKELRDIKNRYDFSLDNRQVVLIVSGLILVMMLAFLMGTLFGKNLARLSDAPEVAAADVAGSVEPAPAAVKPAAEFVTDAVRVPEAAGEPAPDREEYIRSLQSMKVPADIEPESTDTPAPPAMARLPQEEDETDAPAEAKPASQPAPKPAAPAPVKPEPKPVPKAVIPAGTYTIQLASLPERGDADGLVQELRGKKYDAFMLQVSLSGKGTWYRVRVGHYMDLDQAKKALAILQKREGRFFDAWITQQ